MRAIFVALFALTCAPAEAALVSYHADGIIVGFTFWGGGTTSLLPLPTAVGDTFQLDFTYDTAAVDSNNFASTGKYSVSSMYVTVGSSGPVAVSTPSITIQTGGSSLWGVSGCMPSCNSGTQYDEVRLNIFTGANSITSDALTAPPNLFGNTIQYGFFSADSTYTDRVLAQAQITSFSAVPLPAAAWLLLSGLAGLGFIGRRKAA